MMLRNGKAEDMCSVRMVKMKKTMTDTKMNRGRRPVYEKSMKEETKFCTGITRGDWVDLFESLTPSSQDNVNSQTYNQPEEENKIECNKKTLHESVGNIRKYKRTKVQNLIHSIQQHKEFETIPNLKELILQAVSSRKKKLPNEEKFYSLIFQFNLGACVTNSFKVNEYFSPTKSETWWQI